MDTIIKCKNCNKDIIKPLFQIKRYKYGFCNKECQLEYISNSSTATIEKCSNCQIDIKRTKNQKRNSKTGIYFCGNKCKNTFIAQKLRWKKRNDNNPESCRKRKFKIFEDANYTCQNVNCGYNEDARMLDLHHVDGNHQNNNWLNLKCICVWCHNLHHRGVEKLIF
jgi:hypothetical protein